MLNENCAPSNKRDPRDRRNVAKIVQKTSATKNNGNSANSGFVRKSFAKKGRNCFGGKVQSNTQFSLQLQSVKV